MKKVLIAGCFLLSAGIMQAQQKLGTVSYERVSQVQAHFNINGMENMVPQSRKDIFELTFGNNQSLWKAAEQENEDAATISDNGGMQIRMVVAGSNDVLFTNFETGKKTEKKEFLDKNFIIDDSVRSLKWKMTGETKNILNMPCMKATTTRISTKTMMNMDNGKMERKEVQDTALIIAWFTTSIPVSAGPAEYQGQLPGLILEMDISNGKQTYVATGISDKADLAIIKEPTGKKHYTPDEFKKERDKMMKEMQENNQGGNRVIRMN
ncbi:MAG TPA: GLPGLI family protein [Chitinophagaceae bacterium]|nr:GLPGLI family protein [Chitinophagaceae bacterium]